MSGTRIWVEVTHVGITTTDIYLSVVSMELPWMEGLPPLPTPPSFFFLSHFIEDTAVSFTRSCCESLQATMALIF